MLINVSHCCCRCWRCCRIWLTALSCWLLSAVVALDVDATVEPVSQQNMLINISHCCCSCWRCCGIWLTALSCWLLWAVVVLGVDTAVEPSSQWRRAHRDHGPGPHLSHQDPRLQLLSGRLWGAGVVVLLGFPWGWPSPETGGSWLIIDRGRPINRRRLQVTKITCEHLA